MDEPEVPVKRGRGRPRKVVQVPTNGEHVICGARKKNGEICQMKPAVGHNRCRFHGANTPIGPSHALYKKGRYSALLPESYRESFAANFADPDINSLRRQIALISAREEELLKRLPTGEHGSAWMQVKKATGDLLLAIKQIAQGNSATAGVTMRTAIHDLQEATEAGIIAEKVWSEILYTVEQKRKLVDTEVRREARLAEVMTPDQLAWLLHNIANLFRDYIRDPTDLRNAILALRLLVGGREQTGPYEMMPPINVTPKSLEAETHGPNGSGDGESE